jgi:hypothetical protein
MYQLQTHKDHRGTSAFNHLSVNNPSVPCEHEAMLFTAVKGALDAGLHYTTDVYAYVVKEMDSVLSQELLQSGKDRLEHGHFGMDIYYMRYNVVEPMVSLSLNQAAMKKLNISVGYQVKNFTYGKHKFSTTTITIVNQENGTYGFTSSKRGTRTTWTGVVEANNPDFILAVEYMAFPSNIKAMARAFAH